jgi:5-methylcytosine-specific restriction endonuclease McrA
VSERFWQVVEGGPLVKAVSKHPWYSRASWTKQLRVFILQRDPLCKVCGRAASKIADHIVPFISPTGIVSWILFPDVNNLRGLCEKCHSLVTSKFDRGFGNIAKSGKSDFIAPTSDGRAGKQFCSSTFTSAQLDRAIGSPEELAELLKGIPE